MENIIVLNIKYKFGDVEGVIHPVVLKDKNEMILVDCGYIGFMPIIEDVFKLENLDCSELTKILITHNDHDHMGALADFKEKYPNIEIVATPGHTPGHISLYLKNKKTLITGDAAALENSQLVIANPQFTLDIENAKKSISKILEYDAETYICYHGGIYIRNRDI